MDLRDKLIELLNSDDIELIKSINGVDNIVYFVKLNGKEQYVAKIYTKRNIEKVNELYKIFEILNENDLRVPKPLVKPFLVAGKPVILSDLIPGAHLSEFDNVSLNAISKTMAQYNRVQIKPINSWYPSISESTSFLSKIKDKEIINLVQEILNSIDDSEFSLLPQALVHGDFSPSNLLFEKDGVLSGILDIDHTCNSYRLLDLARSMVFFAFPTLDNFSPQIARSMIDCYSEYNKLSEVELKNLINMLKTLLIKMLLETHYYVYVAKEVSEEIFLKSTFNQSSSVLFNKLKTIKDLKTI